MYLKDLVDIQMGQSPDSKFYNYDKIGLPFYQGKADFGRINPTPKIWCSKSKKEAKPNDILISVRAPVGDLNINNEQSCIGRGLAAITCKSDVDMMYLYYHLKYLKPQLSHISTGSTFESINRSQLENLIIDYKPYSEQIKISNILQVVQRQIEVREKLLRLYDLLIKSRFVELFGDIDCNTKNWPIITLENLAELITDGEHSTPKRSNEGIYLLSARNILNHSLKLDDVDYIDENEYSRISKRVIPKAGDILLSCSGSVGRCCVVPLEIKFQLVRSVALIRFKSEITPIFAEYMITSDWFQRQINSLKTASSQANLFQGRIKKLKGFVPDINLQYEFIKVVNQINKLKSDVEKSIDETQLLMDSLMQEYFG
jgi:restriction endonuclease, S subunit